MEVAGNKTRLKRTGRGTVRLFCRIIIRLKDNTLKPRKPGFSGWLGHVSYVLADEIWWWYYDLTTKTLWKRGFDISSKYSR